MGHKNRGKYLQTLLKARKIRIFSGRECIVITILHLQPSPLCICTTPLSFLHHAIKYYSYPTHIQLSKIKLQSMQLCKYISTKTVFKQIFQTLRKLQRRELLKKCKYRNFSSRKHNIYSLPLFLLNPNSKISRQFFKETNQPLDCEIHCNDYSSRKRGCH